MDKKIVGAVLAKSSQRDTPHAICVTEDNPQRLLDAELTRKVHNEKKWDGKEEASGDEFIGVVYGGEAEIKQALEDLHFGNKPDPHVSHAELHHGCGDSPRYYITTYQAYYVGPLTRDDILAAARKHKRILVGRVTAENGEEQFPLEGLFPSEPGKFHHARIIKNGSDYFEASTEQVAFLPNYEKRRAKSKKRLQDRERDGVANHDEIWTLQSLILMDVGREFGTVGSRLTFSTYGERRTKAANIELIMATARVAAKMQTPLSAKTRGQIKLLSKYAQGMIRKGDEQTKKFGAWLKKACRAQGPR
jgi:hypothetical protein